MVKKIDNIILNKAEIIERCIHRIHEEYDGHEAALETNFTKQDSILLNIQRAAEASIDQGMRLIRIKKLGIPQSGRDVFVVLEKHHLIHSDLSSRLQAMVGFRNIAVHDYSKLNLDIVRSVIDTELDHLLAFSSSMLKHASITD